MIPRLFATLVAAACLCPMIGFAEDSADGAGNAAQPLTRGGAAEILANTDTVAEGLERMVKKPGNSRDEAIFADVSDVMAHASEWRWYSRDRGILLAIPVRERLGIAAQATAEEHLADIVRRLIYQQGWGDPPVQVIFIEPERPLLRPCRGVPVVNVATCGCL